MKARRILAAYCAVTGLHALAASLVWGIQTLFLLAAGLDLLEVFLVNGVYTAAIALFEIPTGVVADARGRRFSFLVSVVFLLLGTLVYAWSSSGAPLAVFVLGALALGLGATFYSGAVEAALVDALGRAGVDTGVDTGAGAEEGAKDGGSLAGALARVQLVAGAATLAGTVGGGLLATLDLSWPYLARAVLLVPAFVLGYAVIREPRRRQESPEAGALAVRMGRVARAAVVCGGRRPVRRLLLAGLVQYGFLTWAFHAWQPYFLDLLGRHAPWVAGVVSALITLATLGGNATVVTLTRRGARRSSVLLAGAGALTLAAVGVGLASSFGTALACLLAVSAAAGVVGPAKQAFLHEAIPSEQRATLLSVDSLVGNAGGALGQTGLGALARDRGIAGGYVVGGLLTALALPLLAAALRRPEGVPVGEALGTRS